MKKLTQVINKNLKLSPLSIGTACVLIMSTQAVPQGSTAPKQVASPLLSLKQSSKVHRIVFSPDGELLATVGDDGLTRLWNARTGQFQQVLHGVHSDGKSGYLPRDIAFSPNAQTFIAAGDALEIWNIKAKTHRVLAERGSFIQSAAFSLTGNFIAIGAGEAEGAQSRMTVKNVQNGRNNWSKTLSGDSYVSSVVFSPNGRVLVNVGSSVNLWNVANGKLIGQLKSKKLFGRDVLYSQDGKNLVIAFENFDDSQINIYEAQSRKLLRNISMKGLKVKKIALSSSNKFIFCANDASVGQSGRSVGIWDFSTGQLLQSIDGQNTFALSSDGKILATSSGDNVSLWKIK